MHRSVITLLGLLLISVPLQLRAAERAPTRAALKRALEAYRHSAVEVWNTERSARGAGVIVGTNGEVLTAASIASGRKASEFRVRLPDGPQPAVVSLQDDRLRVALLTLQSAASPSAAAVGALPANTRRPWLIGIERGTKGKLHPRATRAQPGHGPFLDVDLKLDPGAPLFDSAGKLVAIVVERRNRTTCRVLPVATFKQFVLARMSASTSP